MIGQESSNDKTMDIEVNAKVEIPSSIIVMAFMGFLFGIAVGISTGCSGVSCLPSLIIGLIGFVGFLWAMRKSLDSVPDYFGLQYLFSTDATMVEELNKGITSEGLQKEFTNRGFSFSDNVTIREEKDDILRITVATNEENWTQYFVTEEEGKSNIYGLRFANRRIIWALTRILLGILYLLVYSFTAGATSYYVFGTPLG